MKKQYNIKRRTLPIVRQLENKYGGKWEYFPFSGWGCEELKMLAHYVYEGGYDIDGNPMYDDTKLFIGLLKPIRVYGNGKRGEEFYPEYK